MMTVVLWVLFLLGAFLCIVGYWASAWAERQLVDEVPDFNASYGEGVAAGVIVTGLGILVVWLFTMIANMALT